MSILIIKKIEHFSRNKNSNETEKTGYKIQIPYKITEKNNKKFIKCIQLNWCIIHIHSNYFYFSYNEHCITLNRLHTPMH